MMNISLGLKALAVTSSKRIAQLPDLPTMAEAGFADFEVIFWMGLLAPTGTPEPTVTKLYEAARLMTTNSKAEAILNKYERIPHSRRKPG